MTQIADTARYDVYRVHAAGSRAEHWGLVDANITGAAVTHLLSRGGTDAPAWTVGEPYLVPGSHGWRTGVDVVSYLGYLVLPAGAPEPDAYWYTWASGGSLESFRLREANDWAREGEREFRAAWADAVARRDYDAMDRLCRRGVS